MLEAHIQLSAFEECLKESKEIYKYPVKNLKMLMNKGVLDLD